MRQGRGGRGGRGGVTENLQQTPKINTSPCQPMNCGRKQDICINTKNSPGFSCDINSSMKLKGDKNKRVHG